MSATVGAASRRRNAPREEVPRPPAGGRRSSAGTTTSRRGGGTLGVMALFTTAADRRGGRLTALDAVIGVAAFAATLALAWRGTAFADETRAVDWATVL